MRDEALGFRFGMQEKVDNMRRWHGLAYKEKSLLMWVGPWRVSIFITFDPAGIY